MQDFGHKIRILREKNYYSISKINFFHKTKEGSHSLIMDKVVGLITLTFCVDKPQHTKCQTSRVYLRFEFGLKLPK